MDYYDESDSLGWIHWYWGLEGNHYLADIDEDYIRDSFNLYGLRQQIPGYRLSLKMILSSEQPDDDDLEDQEFKATYPEACDLYGLIHHRYIRSPIGLQTMKEKFLNSEFGFCPRVKWMSSPVIPTGLTDKLGENRVKLYWPKWKDVYYPNTKTNLDGAYLGVGFPFALLTAYPELKPEE